MRYLRYAGLAAALCFLPGLAVAQNLDFAKVTEFHSFIEEFDGFEIDQWINTETGSGTRAVADADGGILVITNAGTDNDHNFLQWSGDDDTGVAENWTFTAGKRLYFEARLKVSEATQLDWIIGLQVTDTSPLATADGIWFGKDDGDALLDIHAAVGSVQTDGTGIATVAADTYMTLAFYYDGSDDNIQAYVDGVSVGRIAITNAPTTELTISIGIQDGEGTADLMSLDYIAVFKERDRQG